MRVCAACRDWSCGGCYGEVVEDPDADAAYAEEMEEYERQDQQDQDEWRRRDEACAAA